MEAAWALRILVRGVNNYRVGRPLVVSFEVTYRCTCDCRHCDKGGPNDLDYLIPPADYTRWTQILQPVAVQISGGEPLTRPDVAEVVRAIKQPNGLPYIPAEQTINDRVADVVRYRSVILVP